jgi:hypothetical protein
MIFLASHVVCSGMTSLQYFLLRILNDVSIQSQQAIKLKAQLLEPLLLRCKDANYVSSLLSQEKRIDPIEFNRLLVEIVGPGSSTAQVSVLLDLVRAHGPLSAPACQQLLVVFPAIGQATQTQIAKLLMNQLENGLSVIHIWNSLMSGSSEDCFGYIRCHSIANSSSTFIIGRRKD